MLSLARWSISHRRTVVIAWILALVGVTALAQGVGRHYANNFTLPGTESQRATDLLAKRFPVQSGDLDTVVWHADSGTVLSPAVQGATTSLLARVATLPHVVGVGSPYAAGRNRVQISADQRTAFATVSYDKRANALPDATGTKLLDAVHAVHVPSLRLAAGGQVIQQAEKGGIGPATAVGVIAALAILFITFGSMLTAGLPLLTAAFGLITGVGLIGLLTNVISTTNFAPQLALMIGLGVGVDYALFIVTRFREAASAGVAVEDAVIQAMDTSGRAILLAGATVIIALLGMFTLGVSFLNGVAVAAAVAVFMTLVSSLTMLPAVLSKAGGRVAGRTGRRAARLAARPVRPSRWRAWAGIVQAHPWPWALGALGVMVAFAIPATALRLDNSDASNNPSKFSSRQAYDLLAQGFGRGFNGPLSVVVSLPRPGATAGLAPLARALRSTADVATVTAPQLSPSGDTAVLRVYPSSAPEALATTELVDGLRENVIPPVAASTGQTVLVGGFTAGAVDFSATLSHKLPLFIGVVVALSALLLMVIFRSLLIPLQAAVMNLLSIAGALGVITALFQWGWLGSLLGVRAGPIEAFLPVMMFAIVFGLSMDYEVFLVSRVREEWVHGGDPSAAAADGIALTGRVISAAAAIMVCVFLSFVLGDQRVIKEFGLGLGSAVFLDALVIRCVLLPATLEILGAWTWKLPRSVDGLLPHVAIEGQLERPPAPAPVAMRTLEPALAGEGE